MTRHSTTLLSLIFLLWPLVGSAAPAPDPPAELGRKLGSLEQATRRTAAQAEQALLAGAAVPERTFDRLEHLRRRQRRLEAEAHASQAPDRNQLFQRARVARYRLADLERGLRTGSTAMLQQLGHPRPRVAPVGGFGWISGTLTNTRTGAPIPYAGYVNAFNSTGTFVDYGYVYSDGTYQTYGLPPGTYYLVTSVYGSFVDELYDNISCPGGAGAGCMPTSGSPVVVTDGSVTANVDFALTPEGIIAGRLRDETTSAPIPGQYVEVADSNGSALGYTQTDSAGRYQLGGLATGDYFVYTSTYTHLDEVYDDQPCLPFCNVTAGTPVHAALGTLTSGIDFELVSYGIISGTVTHEASGLPVSDIEIEIYSSAGYWVDYAYSAADGSYSIGGLAAGSHFARTYDYDDEYLDELYDNLPCASGCTVTSGTPINVALGSETGGIDFALQRSGRITGRLTDALSGAPIDDAYIWASQPGGGGGSDYTDSNGVYTIRGLVPGNHTVTTSTYEHQNEVYDDLPCTPSCPTSGTPVPVALDQLTSGIDFALEHLGWISGRVTEEASGAGIPSVYVRAYRSSGSFADSTYTDASGNYRFPGLSTGDYFVVTESSHHLDELYDDLPCEPSCIATTGTSIPVTLGNETTGIDFALRRLGKISGRVTEEGTGVPLGSQAVFAYDADGISRGSGYTDSTGGYQIDQLVPGNYFVVTATSVHRDEVWNDILCSPSCNPTIGTPVPVAIDSMVTGIDFALARLGSVEGRVLDSITGLPLYDAFVSLRNAAGTSLRYDYTDSQGRYQLAGVDPGSYYLMAEEYRFETRLYPNVPCPGGPPSGCTVTNGTPVTVVLGATTSGIDLSLPFVGPGIAGHVWAQGSDQPLAGVAIDVWNQDGSYEGTVLTDATGYFRFYSYGGYTYHLSTDAGLGGLDEVWDNVPCPAGPAFLGLCDPTAGTPLVMGYDPPYPLATDFILSVNPIFADGFESGDLSAWTVFP
ncbi:MAG TPA: carboxypeptidase regulatory-like domain-containing protein [Thermoanaerobaculia bacterium]|nr:carboxypeptidase regulatory-like domain-containing protein [Thermoanaerobaculia bacterium]